MDPRQHQSLSRNSSQNNYSPMTTSYSMPGPYQTQNHLPPINYPGLPPTNQQGYMPQQQYRQELPRYPSSSGPGPASTPDRYNAPMPHQNNMQGLPPASMLPQPQGQQSPYPNSQTPQPTRQGGYQQPLAPAPPRPNLDQMGNSYPHPDQRQAWSGPEGIPSMTSEVGRDPTRTHVVGSQGRRGILPSAPGRPPVAQNGLNGSPKGGQIPQKDADGKFPCPNCTKTYLHAKHLKRHMLRHTGDRPYMCVLCNDTFSRSDILKRHFQKCSVRRGNPTGASHLSNPAAHLKKSQAAAAKAAQNAAGNASPASATTPVSAGIANAPYTSTSMAPSSIPTTAAGQPPSSMPYAMNNPQGDMQRPPPSQGMPPNQSADGNNAWGMQNPRDQQMMYHQNSNQHYGMPPSGGDDKRNIPAGHQMGDEWNQMFPAGGNEHYMNPMFSAYEQSHGEVKPESHEGQSNGYYIPPTSLGADGTSGPSSPWNFMSAPQRDPLQRKSERLVDFCFPQESLRERQNNPLIQSCLSVDAITHFLVLFSNSQAHFPWLHLPTLKLEEIYDGLLLTIICNGAVYSDRVNQDHVRALIQQVKYGIERTARVYSHMTSFISTARFSESDIEYEEMVSLLMLYTMMIWHGGPVERAIARDESRRVRALARRFDMLRLAGPNDSHLYSYLHNLSPGENAEPALFDWHRWVNQEKHIRLAFLFYLQDSAMVLYFNEEPQFSTSELTLPLPADDAAWEAPDAEACARALGLRGRQLQTSINTTGSLRIKSLEFHHAMKALYNPSVSIQPLTTNVYSKFLLIHALHVDIWRLQRDRSFSPPRNSPHTPSAKDSFKLINMALVRWKSCWDEDMALQYPQTHGIHTGPRRVGFCRDSTQFWWLARALLQPNRAHDWQLASEDKLRLTMKGLDQARSWSSTDGAQRGEEPGSVALIDPNYAASDDLILDMRKLFRPLDHSSGSSGQIS